MKLPSQADIEREWREALRKGQLDYLTDMRAERRLGYEEGRVMATIWLLQRALRQPQTDDETLEAMNRVELFELQSKLTLEAMNRVELFELQSKLTLAAREAGIEVEDI